MQGQKELPWFEVLPLRGEDYMESFSADPPGSWYGTFPGPPGPWTDLQHVPEVLARVNSGRPTQKKAEEVVLVDQVTWVSRGHG